MSRSCSAVVASLEIRNARAKSPNPTPVIARSVANKIMTQTALDTQEGLVDGGHQPVNGAVVVVTQLFPSICEDL